MKVGTDGVLLGAWAEVLACQRILDVGTGSALIALMLAQRNPEAIIDGVEVDGDSARQACENVAQSPFASHIHIHHNPIQSFLLHAPALYDHVVSNPPYFVQSLKSPDARRSTARHSDTLSLTELFETAKRLLKPQGKLSLVLPYQHKEEVMTLGGLFDMSCSRLTDVCPTKQAVPKRILVEFSNAQLTTCVTNQLVLEEQRHQRSTAYHQLTNAFYL